jgi:hypothetical protein
MTEVLRAISIVAEGFCPLCTEELIRHGDNACCPCGGCSFRLDGANLWMGVCSEHPPRTCAHWQAIWRYRMQLG